ncbi:hypothetical protein HAX54_037800 [Datura stramonium]|uniref:Uncharacterized protein n=1 Tax=Datura stramonium TaxID=4076 RepID=A0ABS8VIS2_DATST|nr:hypothetical protein [Datura stramonium]
MNFSIPIQWTIQYAVVPHNGPSNVFIFESKAYSTDDAKERDSAVEESGEKESATEESGEKDSVKEESEEQEEDPNPPSTPDERSKRWNVQGS